MRPGRRCAKGQMSGPGRRPDSRIGRPAMRCRHGSTRSPA
ncbi:protein of unassigned function [Methylobacterium oryzae CBMB20]|uniref:Protein of unassigned function n=1 Tax=Methylobacterium oryzae CBMB20 TaxID=693986 RepID=A0A089NRA3_9HYPH|nr:protein of unassigned function [Methylobacterium oryzae CBMB20]